MRKVYYVTITTVDTFDAEAYHDAAIKLVEAYHSTLGDAHTLSKCLHSQPTTRANVEVDVCQLTAPSPARIIASAVVDLEGPDKLPFDKNSFTHLIRKQLSFPVKVTKRVVAPDELT